MDTEDHEEQLINALKTILSWPLEKSLGQDVIAQAQEYLTKINNTIGFHEDFLHNVIQIVLDLNRLRKTM